MMSEGRATAGPRQPAKPLWQGRWWLPTWTAVLGAVMFGAAAIGGDLIGGLILAACFVLVAGVFAFAEHSESLRGIGGVDGDERFARIETRSMATAGRAMALAIVAGWAYELSQGNDGAAFTWILGIGVLAYVAAMIWIRGRS